MNARIVFVFGLVFTLLNIVMAFTTHGGLFIMAGLGLIITLGSANYIWGTPASAMSEDEFDDDNDSMLITADEQFWGRIGADEDGN